jgi:multimeric flavodoxin WrbA
MDEEKKFLAVGIAGSPRRMGNSTALLRAYLEGAASEGFATRIIFLNQLLYRGCQACDKCVMGEECGVQDDLNQTFPLLEKANIWALSSPIYYDMVSGQMKSFFDRMRFSTYDPHKLKGPRRGIVIVTYEDDRSEFYLELATRMAGYFSWNNRGDFGNVRVVAEPNLGSRDAWKERPDLLKKMNEIGIEQANELKI